MQLTPSCDSPNTSWRFALGARDACLVGENPTCSDPSRHCIQGRGSLWLYDYGYAQTDYTPSKLRHNSLLATNIYPVSPPPPPPPRHRTTLTATTTAAGTGRRFDVREAVLGVSCLLERDSSVASSAYSNLPACVGWVGGWVGG